MIYLDNAATSWPKPEAVYAAVDDCLRNCGGSPGRGGHRLARAASQIVFDAREEVAVLLGIRNSSSLIFAYNATDALNMALFGLLKPGDKVVTTSMEHNAVTRTLRVLERQGVALRVIQADERGQTTREDFRAALAQGATAVVVGHGSNVTGALAPLAEIGPLAAEAGAILIVDAAQTAGVEDIDVAAMGIDVLAFSGHKGLLGPQGTGGLYVRDDLSVTPLRFGGTGSQSESDAQPVFYPDRLESGTANTPGLAGLLAGVRFIRETGPAVIRNRERELTDLLLEGLSRIPGVTLYGPAAGENRTAVVSFTVRGRDSGETASQLDREYGIACRGGLHCAPWAHRTIGTLRTGTVRFSPGYYTTRQEIDAALLAVREIAGR